jgi:hypothetical protein
LQARFTEKQSNNRMSAKIGQKTEQWCYHYEDVCAHSPKHPDYLLGT